MAAENGHLSRQADVYATPGNRNPLLCILDDQWHPVSNPNGFLSIGVAENVSNSSTNLTGFIHEGRISLTVRSVC